MGQFEVELLSQKFIGTSDFSPVNWRIRLLQNPNNSYFGYCQDVQGVYLLWGQFTTDRISIVQQLIQGSAESRITFNGVIQQTMHPPTQPGAEPRSKLVIFGSMSGALGQGGFSAESFDILTPTLSPLLLNPLGQVIHPIEDIDAERNLQ